MQSSQVRAPTPQPVAPRWIWWTLLAGSAGLMAWGFFLTQFHSEPSAVGRVGFLLEAWSALSTLGALAGIAALFNLLVFRDDRRRRGVAAVAAIMMTITLVGAVVGVPVLIALYSGRKSSRT